MRPLFGLAAVLALAAPAAAQIESTPLAVIDAFSTGAGGRGLGQDLWQGASTPLVRQVLPTLGQRPMSPAAMLLARHVLATGAAAPDGAGSDNDLAGQRLLALIDLGDARDADVIVRGAPSLADSEPLAHAGAESALILNHPDRACSISRGLQVGRDGAYWLELRAFCQAMAGDLDKAQITFSLANEAAKDPVFRRLLGAKLIGTGAPPAPSLRDGLDLALVRSLALDPAPALDTASPAVAADLARDGNLPPDVRLAAAARAVRGALTLDELFDGGQPPLSGAGTEAADPAATIKALAGKPGVAAQAGLVGVALKAADPAVAGAALDALFARAKTPADFVTLSRLAIPAVRALAAPDKAQDRSLASPLRLAWAAVAAGDVKTAQAIRARISRESVGASDLAILDAAIAALGAGDPQTLDRLAERGGHDGVKAPTQVAAVLFLALGDALSPDARAEVAGFDVGKPAASVAKLTLLDSAAAAKVKGEAAILALSLAADAGPAGLAPADRTRVVAALRRAGLEADARALDAEGLLSLK